MKVSVEGQLAEFVDREVRTGRYASAGEVVSAALARLQTDRELASADEVAELRAELDTAIEEADAGRYVEYTAKDIKSAGRARLSKRRKGK